ncbi:hypothetical protein Q7C36_019067 [Tachysurus vachellii]|uniref:Uncharacterized protein n=1 Tax=Tachysurus vachellii TaxID=175792 RepID=A0AA88LVT6_TACVA|nr:hypothetical protein Q7C36_019067 [Tachysurus vachellii]
MYGLCVFTEANDKVWASQQRHLECIQDPKDSMYRVAHSMTIKAVDVPYYKCLRGSNSLEGFHKALPNDSRYTNLKGRINCNVFKCFFIWCVPGFPSYEMLKMSVKTSVSSTAQSLSTCPGMLSGPGALHTLILLKDLLTLSASSPGHREEVEFSEQWCCFASQSEQRRRSARSAERCCCHRSVVGACSP